MNQNTLPEDFNINILLPGATWLLVSAFMGYAVVTQMETNAITVILFIVVMLVAFIIPMSVYMEYRKKIEECFLRRKQKDTSVAEFQRTTTTGMANTLPQDFPDALKGSKSLSLLDALRREGFLNTEYRPGKECNATQMAFIANSIGIICNISYQWKTFGGYWQLPNLRQLLATKERRGSKMEKEDIIIDLLKRTAEADGEICSTDAYRHWLRSVQN